MTTPFDTSLIAPLENLFNSQKAALYFIYAACGANDGQPDIRVIENRAAVYIDGAECLMATAAAYMSAWAANPHNDLVLHGYVDAARREREFIRTTQRSTKRPALSLCA